MADQTVVLKDKGLKQLLKAFKGNIPEIRAGISDPKNAVKLAAAEFGTSKSPRRSVIQVPLQDHLQAELDKQRVLEPARLREIIRAGSLRALMEQIAKASKNVILGAFDTAGYGKWKASDMIHKKTHQTLVETGEMKSKIEVEVK